MQTVKCKDGVELVSMELDRDRAKVDIVEKLIKYALGRNEGLFKEMNLNMGAIPGAVILLRVCNEMVNMDECSEEFREVVKVQRELVEKMIGDIPVNENEEANNSLGST